MPITSEIGLVTAERVRDELDLSFRSIVGRQHVVQATDGLVATPRADLLKTQKPGTGGNIHIMLPIQHDKPRVFFRVRQQ